VEISGQYCDRLLTVSCSSNRGGRKAASIFFGLMSFCIFLASGHAAANPGFVSQASELHQSPVWESLLHFRENKLQIRDDKFILSLNRFSPKNELAKTIQIFTGENWKGAVCRFPARYLWLKNHIALPNSDLEHCVEYWEFQKKAPADVISLIFASEKINQPSSMMGHIFLKLSGKDADGSERQHAISFYTNADTYNIPKVIFENFVTGMPGIYSLVPFDEALKQYAMVEGRTIWEYQLRLNGSQRQLMQAHLFELRDIDFKYYFHSYNCASLIKELLYLVNPEATFASDYWTTPKDVIKHASQAGLIAKTNVTPSTKLALRLLMERLTDQQLSSLQTTIDRNLPINVKSDGVEDSAFLSLEFSRNYSNLLFEGEKINKQTWEGQIKRIDELLDSHAKGQVMEVGGNLDPINSPQDSQFSVGGANRDGGEYIYFKFLPASHSLLDDQGEYFGDSELKIFELTLLKSIKSDEAIVDNFTLYSTKSISAWNKITGGISSSFNILYDRQYNQRLEPKYSSSMNGDVGLSFGWGRDIDAYVTLGGGVGYGGSNGFVQGASKAGFLLRGLFGMKSHLFVEKKWNPLGDFGFTDSVNFQHKFRLRKQVSLDFEWKKTGAQISEFKAVESTVALKYIF
jgi:Domain of unknown function (DUF4105)